MQFSSLSLHGCFPFSIPPAQLSLAGGVGRVLPAAWQALPLILPGFSGLTLAFQRLEVQSRRRAALAASLFPNIERQREKSLLLPAHQSHHHCGCWPSPPKNNLSATGHTCFLGTKGDNTPQGSRDGTGQDWGNTWDFFLHPLAQRIELPVLSQQCKSIATRDISLFVFTSGIQPVQLRITANCFFQLGAPHSPLCSRV